MIHPNFNTQQYNHLKFKSSQDLVNRSAEPFTPLRTNSLESTYVPQTSFVISNISGGTWIRTSRTTLPATLTFFVRGSPRFNVTSMSLETSLATGRLVGNSLNGMTFLHFLPESFWANDSRVCGLKENCPVVSSSLRYSCLPAFKLNDEFTCIFPLTPVLSWGHVWPTMTLKSTSEENERVVFDFDALDIVRCALPTRTRVGGCRRVRPMCLPVQYSRRHFPGSISSQLCQK